MEFYIGYRDGKFWIVKKTRKGLKWVKSFNSIKEAKKEIKKRKTAIF